MSIKGTDIHSQFDLSNLVNTLECPVSMTPLRNAVSLVPCMHKINKEIAFRMFGTMDLGICSNQGAKCPVCRLVVREYQPDHVIREIVRAIFIKNTCEEVHPALLQISSMPSAQEPIEMKEVKQQKFIFIPAVFEHRFGDWSCRHDEGGTNELRFESNTTGSTIQGFSLFRFLNTIRLRINFVPNDPVIKKHFSKSGITLDPNDLNSGMLFVGADSDLLKMRTLFLILSHYNTIPQDYIGKLRILMTGEMG